MRWRLGCVGLVIAQVATSRADTPEPATGDATPAPVAPPDPMPAPAPAPMPPAPAASPAPVSSPEVASVAAHPALRPVLATRGWTLALSGYVQADYVAYAQDSLDELDPATNLPLDQTHFGIPRASLRADGKRGAFSGELELEAFTTRATLPRQSQTSGVRLEIATARWHHGELVELAAGLFRTPFGAQTPTSPRTRPFLELPTFLRALMPGDIDAGVQASGGYGLVRYSVAVMNGAPVGDAQWQGRDPSSSVDLIARVGTDVPLPHRGRIVAGVSALTGTGLHPGTPPTKDAIQWIDENQDGLVQTTELMVIPGTPGEPSQTFHHDALDLDVAGHWCLRGLGHGVVQLEAAIAKNLDRGLVYADPVARSRDVRELGFSLGIVQDLGPYAQAGVRYDRYDADRDANEREGVSTVYVHEVFSTLALMAAARLDGTKLMVEYDHAQNPFGRDDTGMPATRQADRLTFRAQVEF